MTTEPAVELRPIGDQDVASIAEFLHRELNSRVSADAWARGIAVRWLPDAPNHGFMLLEDGRVIGANLAFYSTREIAGRTERICNLGALCVVETRRAHAVRLVRAVLRQPGYHFTDLSPSGNVVELNRRLGFRDLDTETALLPNWPVPSRGPLRLVTGRAEIEQHLTGHDLTVFRDHRFAPAVRHAVLTDGAQSCYVASRRARRKRLPLFMFVLYVGNADLFRRGVRLLGRHYLLRGGTAATLLETRVVGRPVTGTVALGGGRLKMFKSAELGPDDIDYLYSELTQIAW